MGIAKRLHHAVLAVGDLAKSRDFYINIMGMDLIEEDPEHGGTFLTLGDNGHTWAVSQSPRPDKVGVGHIAFQVDSEEDLKKAYWHLIDHGVKITAAIDHISQKSIYFKDPDGNSLEICHEAPNALEIFAQGRQDKDEPITFTR